MRKSEKSGITFVIMGVVLILSALLLLFYNKYEEYRAGQEAENLMADIQSAIEKQTKTGSGDEKTGTGDTGENGVIGEAGNTGSIGNDKGVGGNENAGESIGLENLPSELPTVTIDGYDYIGYISIPDLELELPVMADWDYSRLKIAPCRHYGSSRTDDLVIAAHNYKTHFGRLPNLEIGAEIVFTDMDGIVYCYTLTKLETLKPYAVDVVLNSEYDLVLYTCTVGGKSRVAAFCERTAITQSVFDGTNNTKW